MPNNRISSPITSHLLPLTSYLLPRRRRYLAGLGQNTLKNVLKMPIFIEICYQTYQILWSNEQKCVLFDSNFENLLLTI